MRPHPCVFPSVVSWTDTSPPPTVPTAAPAVPLILTDFTVPPFNPSAMTRVADVLRSACDAVLVGEHQNRPDYPPSVLGAMVLDLGLSPWVTLACRDRNRVVLEQELRALAHAGGGTVLCVTGDGRASDVRPDVTQVFDLDGTRLAALAAHVGLVPAVPETPTAPPTSLRPARLVEKQKAGARVGVLNHVVAAGEVAQFMDAALAAGLTIPVLAAVTVYTDAISADALTGLPGLQLDVESVQAVLTAADPVEVGIQTAVAEAQALLAIPGIEGVNISGLASAQGFGFAAEVKAEIGRRIRRAVAA